jgi:hypothetical protein
MLIRQSCELVARSRAIRVTAALGLVAVILSLVAAPALAERVKTKTGQTFTGQIVEQDATKIVLRTMSGDMSIPMDTVLSIEKDGATVVTDPTKGGPSTTAITPVTVDPLKAAEAMAHAKSALVAGEWVKAGSLLEGLMALDERSFGLDDRLAATGALVTCYLQVKDPAGAAKALTRRAQLASDLNDKRRLMAAAEALRTVNSVVIGGKPLTRFEEVLAVAMTWKADRIFAEAKDLAAKAQRLNEPAMLDKAATTSLKKLAEADIFMPGYSASHKSEVLGAIVTNIVDAGAAAVDYCSKERPILTQARLVADVTIATVREWNGRATPYLAKRQAAEDALKALKAFTTKYDVAALYTSNTTTITEKLKQLDEYQYYPVGTTPYPYYPLGYSSSDRIKITLK